MPRKKSGLRLTDDPKVNEDIQNLVAGWKTGEFSDDLAEMIASLFRLSQQDPTIAG
jgi:hypothetical protein